MLANPVLHLDPLPLPSRETYLPFDDATVNAFLRSGTASERAFRPSVPVTNDNGNEFLAVLNAARVMLRTYWMHFSEPLRTGLFKQTNVVLSPDQWDDEELIVSLDSYKTLLRSLVRLQPLVRPKLGISHLGNFLAGWHSDNAKVVIEFLPHDRMKWLIVRTDGEVINRAAGQTNVGEICTIVDALHGRPLVDGQE